MNDEENVATLPTKVAASKLPTPENSGVVKAPTPHQFHSLTMAMDEEDDRKLPAKDNTQLSEKSNASDKTKKVDELEAHTTEAYKGEKEKVEVMEHLIGQGGAFELEDSDSFVEETPPSRNPAGLYDSILQKKRKWEKAAFTFVPYQPKTIGSFRDQDSRQQTAKSRFCSCRMSKCLKLYCDCFAAASYCNDLCVCEGCGNTANKADSAARNKAVHEAVVKYPNAFRKQGMRMPTKAACGKDDCKCFLSGVSCVAAKCPCKKCHRMPLDEKRNYLPGSQATKTPSTTDDSSSLIPMTLDGNVVRGIAFSLTDPRWKKSNGQMPKLKSTPREASSTGAAGQDSKVLVHDLMLSPSKALAVPTPWEAQANCTHGATPDVDTFLGRGTSLERRWQIETQDLQQFLSTIKDGLKRRHEGTSVSGLNTIESQAALVRASLASDLLAVKKAADAAEIDILTRLRGHKPHRVESILSDTTRQDDSGAFDALLCNESLPEFSVVSCPSAESEEFRKLVTMAARDTVILRETARVIRRKARELCERRIENNTPSRS